MDIQLIACIGRGGELGREGSIIWRIADDLKLFKMLTYGNYCVVGRKTYDETGRLPGRLFSVVSGDVTPQRALAEAMRNTPETGKVCVIGGAMIYRALLPHCTEMVLTHIHSRADADTTMPRIDWRKWSHGSLITAGWHGDISYETRLYRRFADGS